MNTAWISILTAVGSFFVSSLSIILGYKLFVMGATGEFKFRATGPSGSVHIESAAPGIVLAVFGMLLAGWTVYRLLPH